LKRRLNIGVLGRFYLTPEYVPNMKFVCLLALCLILSPTRGASQFTAGLHASMARPDSRFAFSVDKLGSKKPFQSQNHCLADAGVERILRARLDAFEKRRVGSDRLFDTLDVRGSTFSVVSSDSLCVIARTTYLKALHGSSSETLAGASASFPAVMLVRLRADRYWIATKEFDNWMLYRRILVDSNWRFISSRF
jgi:hypothetical protein